MKNNKGLSFKIIKRVNVNKDRPYFEIEFLNTKYRTKVSDKSILSKHIKDPYNPNKYGVGYFGKSDSKIYNGKAYKKWDAMLSRCYNQKNIQYKNYGESGCRVCERWHSFENFVNDIPLIEGWDISMFENGLLQLDKDIKIKGNKIYSKDNCMLVTRIKNMSVIPSVMKDFIGIDPNGIKHEGYSVAEFSRKHNLERKIVSRILNGEFKTHKGWRFKYIDK